MNVCYYCGSLADTRDHPIPVSYTSVKRHYTQSNLLPCCKECNNHLSNNLFPTLEARSAYLLAKYERRYKKVLSLPVWEEEELSELSNSLRASILLAQEQKAHILDRLEWLRRRAFSESTAEHSPE